MSIATRPKSSPAVVLLDVGNSRLKWALVRLPGWHLRSRWPQKVSANGSFAVESLRRANKPLAQVLRRGGAEARVYVCNVAGPIIERRIRATAATLRLRAPVFIGTAASVAGVVNGYQDAWRLGVDRWVALIGAHHQRPG